MKLKFSILTTAVIILILCVLLSLLLFISIVTNKKNMPNSAGIEELYQINKKTVDGMGEIKIRPVETIDKNDHLWGDINAKVQIIIYSDFECPFCQQYQETIKMVKQEFKDKVVIAFRHYPLRMHDYALLAAEASECAAEQGKFWEMYDRLYLDNQAQRMNSEQFKIDAKELALDQVKFNICLETEKYRENIINQMAQGKLFGVTGTPTTFINKRNFPGAYPFEDFTDSQGIKREGLKNIILGELAK